MWEAPEMDVCEDALCTNVIKVMLRSWWPCLKDNAIPVWMWVCLFSNSINIINILHFLMSLSYLLFKTSREIPLDWESMMFKYYAVRCLEKWGEQFLVKCSLISRPWNGIGFLLCMKAHVYSANSCRLGLLRAASERLKLTNKTD